MKAVICAELFDGTSVEIRKDWTLLVDQGNVVTSGPFSDVEIPEGADLVPPGPGKRPGAPHADPIPRHEGG